MSLWTWVPLIILFVLFFAGMPVAYSMIIAAASYLIFSENSMNIITLIQRMQTSQESFVYLAVPFFTCAGVVFNYAGITRRLMDLADTLVGHMVGGLGHVNILLSTLMGGLSGSANADAAMEAKMLVPQMERLGYDKAFSCVVTAASSCITTIIPPGIILILYATSADVSVAKMFYAGYLPGIIICASQMILTWFISKKRNYQPTHEKMSSGKDIWHAFKESFWALLVPFGILGGLRLGMFTPTEAGAIAIFYSLIIGVFVYREIKPADLIPILKESVSATAGIMFILAGANAFAAYLTWENLPQKVSAIIIGICSSPWQFMLLVNILLLIVGLFFDPGAAIILVAPLLVPAAMEFGFDLIHFGMVICINLVIGGITPPFGNMMFITTAITGTKIEDFTKEAIPYIVLMIAILMVLAFVPGIILLVPRLLS